ncbi:MAG: type I methionyl aminopeptidase [Acidimicrobiia bacterium]
MSIRKTATQLAKMRAAGRVVAEMHEKVRAAVVPGVTTARLDKIARDVIERRGATSNFLNYHGYPAVICASVNEVVVHGIPSRRKLVEGDIVSIDCGAIIDGWHADAAFTVGVGQIDDESQRLIAAAEAGLDAAVAAMVEGNRLSDIGHAVESVAVAAGFGVLRDYCGHGIGTAMHERPDVPNYGDPGKGLKLRPGIVLAVEPMLVTGEEDVDVANDGWSVVTLDGGRAAHTEHTIVVTDDGPDVLTRP